MPEPTEQHKFHQLLNASDAFSFRIDLSKGMVDFSSEFSDLCGINNSDVQNLEHFYNFLSTEDQLKWGDLITDLKESKTDAFTCSFEIINSNSKSCVFQARGKLADSQSSIVEGLCFLQPSGQNI